MAGPGSVWAEQAFEPGSCRPSSRATTPSLAPLCPGLSSAEQTGAGRFCARKGPASQPPSSGALPGHSEGGGEFLAVALPSRPPWGGAGGQRSELGACQATGAEAPLQPLQPHQATKREGGPERGRGRGRGIGHKARRGASLHRGSLPELRAGRAGRSSCSALGPSRGCLPGPGAGRPRAALPTATAPAATRALARKQEVGAAASAGRKQEERAGRPFRSRGGTSCLGRAPFPLARWSGRWRQGLRTNPGRGARGEGRVAKAGRAPPRSVGATPRQAGAGLRPERHFWAGGVGAPELSPLRLPWDWGRADRRPAGGDLRSPGSPAGSRRERGLEGGPRQGGGGVGPVCRPSRPC